jgi:hypothetical protein
MNSDKDRHLKHRQTPSKRQTDGIQQRMITAIHASKPQQTIKPTSNQRIYDKMSHYNRLVNDKMSHITRLVIAENPCI